MNANEPCDYTVDYPEFHRRSGVLYQDNRQIGRFYVRAVDGRVSARRFLPRRWFSIRTFQTLVVWEDGAEEDYVYFPTVDSGGNMTALGAEAAPKDWRAHRVDTTRGILRVSWNTSVDLDDGAVLDREW